MINFTCKFCNETFQFEKGTQCGGHITNCKENPKHQEIRLKGKLTLIKRCNFDKQKRIDEYVKNAKLCVQCNDIILYNKKNNKFCSKSCSASYTNSKRPPRSLESRKKTSKTLRTKLESGLIIKKPPSVDQLLKFKNTFANKRKDFKCPICGIILKLPSAKLKNRKFCSGTCRNICNNKFITGTISKAERLLKERLTIEFPNLEISYNNRTILPGNKELDVYIPLLNLAIEWNGVYHYKPIHSVEGLEKTQKGDLFKTQYCKNVGIQLIVIKDLDSSKNFITETIDELVQLIKCGYSSIGRARASKPR